MFLVPPASITLSTNTSLLPVDDEHFFWNYRLSNARFFSCAERDYKFVAETSRKRSDTVRYVAECSRGTL